ncbi:fructoselysine-6-P-deglycase FrlB-like protein [Streptomyces sp. HB372]|nr:fructoselysine-6-P-deglycase FrlB-like protein [Streptomyces sp. HB372]
MSATPPADPGGQGDEPGRIMSGEMAEQPAMLRRILEEGAPRIREVAAEIAARKPRFVLLTARGTSDNAALYAKYLLEIRLGLPCGLASMSTTTAYGARPDLRDVLVVTVSQSGGSPDLVASTRAAREAGAVTLAVTNNPDSALAAVSDYHIDILAGPEKALPATKTYTASLLSLYLFVEGLRGTDGTAAAAGLPDLAGAILGRRAEVRALASRYRFAERMVITSRGYGYPTAKEAALKLMETSYIPALSYSGADLLHGPLAMVDNISPVIAVVTDGRGGRGPPAGAGPAARTRRGSLRGRPQGPGGGGLGRLLAAHGGRPGGAAADPGDPAAADAGVRGDDRPGTGPGRAPRPGQGHRDPLRPRRRRHGPRKHPRAAAPERDPQPTRHRSPELPGRRCAVPPATGGTGAVRAESAGASVRSPVRGERRS